MSHPRSTRVEVLVQARELAMLLRQTDLTSEQATQLLMEVLDASVEHTLDKVIDLIERQLAELEEQPLIARTDALGQLRALSGRLYQVRQLWRTESEGG